MRFIEQVKRVGASERVRSKRKPALEHLFNPALSHALTRSASVLVFLALALTACSDKRITKANVDEVTEGMAKKQVESILGQPNNIDIKDAVNHTTVYVYRQGKDLVTVVFKDDKVQSKQSTLTE